MENHNPESLFSASPPSSHELSNVGFVERGRRIKMAAEMGLVQSSRGRHWSRALRRRLLRKKGRSSTSCGGCKNEPAAPIPPKVPADLAVGGGGGGADEVEEAEEIEMRVRALQKLVPGGEELGVEQLFDETADYIEALQGQVSVMRTLAGLLDGLEREKRMMGG